MDDEYDELDFGDQDGPSLFDVPETPPPAEKKEPVRDAQPAPAKRTRKKAPQVVADGTEIVGLPDVAPDSSVPAAPREPDLSVPAVALPQSVSALPEASPESGSAVASDAGPAAPLTEPGGVATGQDAPTDTLAAQTAAPPVPAPRTPAPATPVAPQPDVPAPPLALYRRYRPDTFSDVIGQEHVTEPLKRALTNNRVNHAYLFSGPRGCGKTTSARILARALNCANGPTPEPCGECDSCRDLARGGPGSIDVIEIDAASHGGVEDARDLREKAFFAPVHSRYKIYIVDEAHMVTTAGFNALLKLVEEPPPHVKFIFATTEPEKVIGTIRSRTHHYPFRLVPPKVLSDYLRRLCDAEGVAIEPTVLPLVVRAGAGSVRDSLSVLDQLLGGAGERGVTYDQSVALLGFTPDALLDEMVDAFAAGDGAGVFATIDKVIEVGQDPRRFAEDLLRRLRDLVIVASVPDAAATGLIDVAADQAERLSVQAAGIGAGELTRAAEVIAAGLVAMRGTTAPRLHLELMCARVLLPGADVDERGVHARLDRLERRLNMPDTGVATAPAPEWPASATSTSERPSVRGAPAESRSAGPARTAEPRPSESRPAESPRRRPWDEPPPEDDWTPPSDRDQAAPAEQGRPALRVVRDVAEPDPSARAEGASGPSRTPPGDAQPPDSGRPAPAEPASREDARGPRPVPQPSAPATEGTGPADPAPRATQAPTAQGAGGGPAATDVRRLWPDVLEEVKRRRRFTWMTISQHAQVAEVADGVLVLAFANPGARDSFLKGGSDDVLRAALVEVMGADLRISALLDSEVGGGQAAPVVPITRDGGSLSGSGHSTSSPDSPGSPDSPAETDAPGSAADEWRADPDTTSTLSHAALLAQARESTVETDHELADVGDPDDPDVDDTDAESLLRNVLHAEVIDDE